MDTKIVAVIVVGLLIAGGISAFVLLNNDDDEPADDSIGRLAVYGNADNNDSLDQRDIEYLQDVINGKKEKNTLCDANMDGNVDSKDIEHVRDLIAKKDGTKVHYRDANDQAQTVEWPVNRVSIIHRSVQVVALCAGLKAPTVSAYLVEDPILFKAFEGASLMTELPKGGGASRLPEFDYLSSFHPDVIVVGQGIDDPTAEQRVMYQNAGIHLLVVSSMDGIESIDSVLTLGFICGDMDIAQAYAKWCDAMLKDVDSKASTIAQEDRKSAYVWWGGTNIAGKGSPYMDAFVRAGGLPATWDNGRITDSNKGWLLNQDVDFMFRVSTVKYGATEQEMSDMYDKFIPKIDQTYAYKHGNYWLIDYSMPHLLRTAYMAEITYPEVYGQGFADGWHQQLLEILDIDFHVDGQFTYNRK